LRLGVPFQRALQFASSSIIALRNYEHEDKGKCEPSLVLCGESRIKKEQFNSLFKRKIDASLGKNK